MPGLHLPIDSFSFIVYFPSFRRLAFYISIRDNEQRKSLQRKSCFFFSFSFFFLRRSFCQNPGFSLGQRRGGVVSCNESGRFASQEQGTYGGA
jgi:hypothetical protein